MHVYRAALFFFYVWGLSLGFWVFSHVKIFELQCFGVLRLPIVGSCCVRNYFGGEQFVNDLEWAPNITGIDFQI